MAKACARHSGLIENGCYQVWCCAGGHVHVSLTQGDVSSDIVFDPEQAYDFAHTVLRGYDHVAGITTEGR